MGRINEAINLINNIINENQNDPSLYVLRARLNIKNGAVYIDFFILYYKQTILKFFFNFKDDGVFL